MFLIKNPPFLYFQLWLLLLLLLLLLWDVKKAGEIICYA